MKTETPQDIDLQMTDFSELTISLLRKGDVKAAKDCLKNVETIFMNGSLEEKNAVLSVHLFSVSSFMEIHHCTIKDLFPKYLLRTYYKQINTSGL